MCRSRRPRRVRDAAIAIMKLALEIAAGILIACGVLWLGGMVLTAGAVQALDESLQPAIKAAAASAQESAARTQARIDQQHAQEAVRATTREREQAARCVVHTVDGRDLHCDPRGSLTPR